MAIETEIHDLAAGPINLRDVIGGGAYLLIQNIGEERIYYAELEAEPATTDDGLVIEPLATLSIGIDVVVDPPPLLGAWIWARGDGRAATNRQYVGL